MNCLLFGHESKICKSKKKYHNCGKVDHSDIESCSLKDSISRFYCKQGHLAIDKSCI